MTHEPMREYIKGFLDSALKGKSRYSNDVLDLWENLGDLAMFTAIDEIIRTKKIWLGMEMRRMQQKQDSLTQVQARLGQLRPLIDDKEPA